MKDWTMKVRTDEIEGRANKAAGAQRHSRKQREKHPSEQPRGQSTHITNAMNAMKAMHRAKNHAGARDESINDDGD